ncbi:hypothetical protein GCM10008119_04880 [Pedobacter mendelii]|uniref:Uncharacterized protein n=1 Tax=Pedobacter mendelii TaxID=1908240 RepID=A0ABQ2BFQ5_9SPHI|nr:hypothetical protein GCM10008119_04880 [Pedobacter mendelii]
MVSIEFLAIESFTNSLNLPNKEKDSAALSVKVALLTAGLLAFNKVSNKGDRSARLNVPKRMDNKVAIT